MIEAALSALLTLTSAQAMPRKPRLDKTMHTEGTYSNVTAPGHRVVENAKQWEEVWREIGRPAPPADLSKNVAVAVFAGLRNTGGFGIHFEEPEIKGDTMTVRYVITRPKGMAIMALTQPWAVKVLPRKAKKVRLEGREQ